MDIVRNFIKISGIANESELSCGLQGQVIQYSETETLYIPENNPGIQNIFQIMIQVAFKSSRQIKTPFGSTVVLDGIKRFKILYTANGDCGKAVFLDLEIPYNAFLETPKGFAVAGSFSEQRIHLID